VDLARMEARIGSRPAGDGCSLASRRFQVVLDVAVASSPPNRKKMREQGIAYLIFRMVAENQLGVRRAFTVN
jgi:hypothetical protein